MLKTNLAVSLLCGPCGEGRGQGCSMARSSAHDPLHIRVANSGRTPDEQLPSSAGMSLVRHASSSSRPSSCSGIASIPPPSGNRSDPG
jgi:hypothetical protein